MTLSTHLLHRYRVFYQGSTDHRGTPESPGRVVTLIPQPGSRVWGRAFKVEDTPAREAEILAYLEFREKQFDQRAKLDILDANGRVVAAQALTFIATEASPNYVGPPASEEELCRILAFNEGPSGKNCDYLFSVAAALREIGAEDPHIFALETKVIQLLQQSEPGAVQHVLDVEKKAAAAVHDQHDLTKSEARALQGESPLFAVGVVAGHENAHEVPDVDEA